MDENSQVFFRETKLNYYFIFSLTFGVSALGIFFVFSFVYQWIFFVLFRILTPNDENISTIATGLVSTILLIGGIFLLITGIMAGVIEDRKKKKDKELNYPTDSGTDITADIIKENAMDSDILTPISKERPKTVLKGLSPKQWAELKEKGFSRSEALDFIKSGVSDSNGTLKEEK